MQEIEKQLYQYRHAEQEIKKLMLDLDKAQSKLWDDVAIRVKPFDSPLVSGGRKDSAVEVEVLKREVVQNEIRRIKEALFIPQATIDRLENLIRCLDSKQRNFVRWKYFEGWSREKICQKLYISIATCKRLRTDVLTTLKQKMKGEI